MLYNVMTEFIRRNNVLQKWTIAYETIAKMDKQEGYILSLAIV